MANKKKLRRPHPKWKVHEDKLTNQCPENAPPQVKAIYEGLRWAILQESAMLEKSSLVPEHWVMRKLREMEVSGLLKTKQSPIKVLKYYASEWFDYLERW